MEEIKLINGFAKVQLEDKKYLLVLHYKDGYSLEIRDYTGKYVETDWLCEDVKRLSTINKYAEKYGVEFVE